MMESACEDRVSVSEGQGRSGADVGQEVMELLADDAVGGENLEKTNRLYSLWAEISKDETLKAETEEWVQSHSNANGKMLDVLLSAPQHYGDPAWREVLSKTTNDRGETVAGSSEHQGCALFGSTKFRHVCCISGERRAQCCFACLSLKCCGCKGLEAEERRLLRVFRAFAVEEGAGALSTMDWIQGTTLARRCKRLAGGATPRAGDASDSESAEQFKRNEIKPDEVLTDRDQFEEILTLFRHANAIYGRALNPATVATTEGGVVAAFAALPRKAFVRMRLESTIARPAWYIAVDDSRKMIVICLRGTKNAADALTDVLANFDGVVLRDYDRESSSGGRASEKKYCAGLAHFGQMQSARNVLSDMQQDLIKTLEEYPAYAIRVTGHSLGGGAAVLLALMLRERCSFAAGRDVRVVAFGCPSVLTRKLSEYCKEFTICIINRRDIIPRLTLNAMRYLLHACLYVQNLDFKNRALISLNLFPKDKIREIERELRSSVSANSPRESVLFVPGEIYHLVPAHHCCYSLCDGRSVEMQHKAKEDFRRIAFPPGFFVDHWPVSYRMSLLRASKSHALKKAS